MELNKEWIISQYSNKKSAREISETLDVCQDTILLYLKKWNIEVRKHNSGYKQPPDFNKIYHCNSKYFSIPTEENCYWAGFIAADGNITDDNSIRILIRASDEEILNEFKDCIQYTGNIHHYNYNGRTYSRIEVFDKELVESLHRIWNITPRKSLSFQFPKIYNESFIRAFIIGYIDGDGSISKSKYKKVQINGTYSLLNWMRARLMLYAQMKFKSNIYKSRSIYNFAFVGKNSDKFFEWAFTYKGFRLRRKWNET